MRQILASLGIARLANLIGRADLLARRPNVTPSVSLDGLLAAADTRRCRSAICDADAVRREALATMEPPLPAVVGPAHPLTFSGTIASTDRAFGTRIAGAIAERHGDAGLPDGSVQVTVTGSAGQSFGAFALPGMRLALVGDANDGVGKGMHGGDIVVAPAARERGRARQVIVGNAALYGATGGRAFIAGAAGERFAIRNSGAIAVVEGVGDHACEYMTGGAVVVLGPVGRNFAAGMTGGAAYVWVAPGEVAPRTHPEQLAIEVPSAAEQKFLRDLIETHERLTGSRLARAILRTDRLLASFCKVTPAQVAAATTEVAEAAAVNQ